MLEESNRTCIKPSQVHEIYEWNGVMSSPRLENDHPIPEYEKWMMEDDLVLGWIKTTMAN